MNVSSYRGVAAAVLAAAVVAGCSSGDKTAAEPADNGPLNGTYRLEFEAGQRLALGQPSPGQESFTRDWAIRSHCGDAGCVATATRLNNDGSASDVRTTLDLLDGKWVMVLGEDSKCNQGGQPARVLGTWVLEEQPDKTLTGTWTEITAGNDCPWVLQMPMTATRQGDVAEGIEVTDPATLPARKPSKPEGFQGAYTQTVTFVPPEGEPGIVNLEAKTFCVRNTDECVTTQSVIRDGVVTQTTPLTFVGDRWTFKYPRPERTCPDGAPMQSTLYDEVLLPEPATNPMDRLTGTRRIHMMDPCPGEQLLDLVYQLNATAPAPPPPAPGAAPEPAPAPVPAPEPVPAPGG
jgi:serine/threonine-protein kinase